jgi:hypothetical protein
MGLELTASSVRCASTSSRSSPGALICLPMSSVVSRLVSVFLFFAPGVHQQRRSQHDAPVEPAASRGLGPPFRASVGCLPHARLERPGRASERCRGGHHTGAAPLLRHIGTLLRSGDRGERSLRLMLRPDAVWQWPTCTPRARAMATVTRCACLPRTTSCR